MNTVHRIETLTRAECLDLLGTAPMGRLVFTDKALPAILPVAFAIDSDSVVVRTARGSRLARAVDRAVVAFEVDQLDPWSGTAWSVVVTAEARVETDPTERERLMGALTPWLPGLKDVILRVPLTVVTGRRLTGIPIAGPVRPAQEEIAMTESFR